jgi:hypothetical protein
MAVSEAERGSARVEVLPFVERIGHLDRLVLALVAVRVSDQRAFPVVVQVRVGDGRSINSVSDIEKTIIVVLVVSLVRPDLNRVNPNTVRSLDADVITGISQYLVNLHTTN